MAIATAAGMLSSMLLTLLVVPVFYLVFDDAAEWLSARMRRRPPAPAGGSHAAWPAGSPARNDGTHPAR
jgi:hypothetical protein